MHEDREHVVPLFFGHLRGRRGGCRYCEIGDEDIDPAGPGGNRCGCAGTRQRVGVGDHGGAVPGEYLAQDRAHEHVGLGDEHPLA